MIHRSSLLAVVLSSALAGAAWAAEPPAASSDSPEAEASLYNQSVTLPRQATACAERIADYLPRFQKSFEAWRSENAVHIANGGRFVHEQAAKGGIDADAGLARLADADVERLHRTSPELLAKHCQLMLESLAPPPAN